MRRLAPLLPRRASIYPCGRLRAVAEVPQTLENADYRLCAALTSLAPICCVVLPRCYRAAGARGHGGDMRDGGGAETDWVA